jgi:LPS-assembly protein
MRIVFLLTGLAAVSVASGQMLPFYRGIQSVLKERPYNPLDVANGSQEVRSGGLPPPVGSGQDLEVIRCENFTQDGNQVKMTGGVEFIYRGYRTFADSAVGDLSTEVFELDGNVRIIGSDALTVDGQHIAVNYRTQDFKSTNSRAILPPSVVGGRAKTPIYTVGGTTFGSERRLQGTDTDLTTCDRDDPHFQIESTSTDLRPGKRIIFRDVRIKLFGKTILSLPFLSIPLDTRRPKYLPEIGQSRDEGFFIKNRYAIPLKDGSILNTRLDYMSKLGVGVGSGYDYAKNDFEGNATAYTILGQSNTLVLQTNHTQRFGWGSFGFSSDYQQNYYLTTPDSRISNIRAQFILPQGRNNTTLSFNRNGSDYSGSRSSNETITVNDNRVIGKFQTNFDVSYQSNSNQYAGSPDYNQRTIDLRARGTRDLKQANLALEYTRSIPVGEIPNFYSGGDKTPVITLSTDSRRLGFRPNSDLNFRSNLSYGEFGSVTSDRVQRYAFDIDANRTDRSNNRFKVDLQSSFKQGYYSDDTAQYTVGAGMNLSYRLGKDTSANVRYQYQRPEGYSPLNIDRSGRYHLATTDITYRPIRYLLLGAQTGYDFNRVQTQDVAWQQFGLRAELNPTKWLGIRTLATYDTISQLWSGIRIDGTYIPGATFLSVGARYDGIRGSWSNVNLFLNGLKAGRTRLSAYAGYNGFSKQIDSYQINAVYDLHCAETVIAYTETRTGFRSGREISIFIRIKAFPTDTMFGIGQRGQPLGTGTGRDF